jgi:hypothetical protein
VESKSLSFGPLYRRPSPKGKCPPKCLHGNTLWEIRHQNFLLSTKSLDKTRMETRTMVERRNYGAKSFSSRLKIWRVWATASRLVGHRMKRSLHNCWFNADSFSLFEFSRLSYLQPLFGCRISHLTSVEQHAIERDLISIKQMENKIKWNNSILIPQLNGEVITFLSPLHGLPSSTMASRMTPQSSFLL